FDTVNTNLKSVYLPCKAAIPHMIKNGKGSIVNISSIGSVLPDLSRIAYCVSKAAINSLTQNIATQYAKDNVRCNAVLPGLIATKAALDNMSPEFIKEFLKHVPLNRIGEPDDIAKAVLFYASDDSSFITGDLLEVAGGFGLPTPQFADNILG
ncbi:TPA: SDR family oxidoreductase, partial [Clostridioides difficile]|nr:SDR family oxidoreductase [Clostridioides difficile]